MRKKRYASILFVLALAVAGCAPSVSESEAHALLAAAPELLSRPVGEIAAPWPPAVAALDPGGVYRGSDGVYISTWNFFVEERGVFILDPASSFVPSRGTDPSYEPLTGDVFSYHIRG